MAEDSGGKTEEWDAHAGENESESESQREVGETGASPGEIQLHMAELSLGYSQANTGNFIQYTVHQHKTAAS